MSWRAETLHGRISEGTVLSVFEQPWADDLPVRPLAPGVTLTLIFPNGAAVKLNVLEATGTEAMIQTSDGTKWRMIEVPPKQLRLPPAGTGGAPTSYWRIEERIADLWTMFDAERRQRKGQSPSAEWVKNLIQASMSETERDAFARRLKAERTDEFVFSDAFYGDGEAEVVFANEQYSVRRLDPAAGYSERGQK